MRKTPVTLGLLSIIFGGLMALWKLFQLGAQGLSSSFMGAMANLPRQPGQPDPTQFMSSMQALMHELAPYTYGLIIGKLLLSVALIVIGFGLYKRRRWARSGAIGWAALALLFVVAEIAINVGIVQPRTMAVVQQMLTTLPNNDPGAAMMNAMKGMQGTMAVVSSLIFSTPYPIVLLALCGRRSAAADFVD